MSEYDRQQFYQKNLFPPNNNNGIYKNNNQKLSNKSSTSDEHQLKRLRLKKSFSECENDDDEINPINLQSQSPTKRKKKSALSKNYLDPNTATTQLTSSLSLAHHHKSLNKTIKLQVTPTQEDYRKSFTNLNISDSQQQINETSTVTFSDQICQIPTVDNYRNRSNYYIQDQVSSSVKGSTLNIASAAAPTHQKSDSQTNSLRRGGIGRSTLSLCSCDADTEIIPDPMRPLYQYSLDRKKPTHTYTCEQNAQILLRLERERQKKNNSSSKLNTITKETSTEFSNGQLKMNYPTYGDSDITEDELTDADFIPPPPPPNLRRNHSFTHHYPYQNLSLNKVNSPQLKDCTSTILNCTSTIGYTNNATILQQPPISNTTIFSSNNNISNNNNNLVNITNLSNNNVEMRITKPPPDLCEFTNKTGGSTTTTAKQLGKYKDEENLSKKFESSAEITLIPPNSGYTNGKTNYEYYFDENFIQRVQPSAKENGSFFLYHQELPQYTPNYDSQNKIPGKFNTIGHTSSIKSLANCHNNKNLNNKYHHHTSNCNLDQFDSNNLLNGRYFSNSLTNFNFIHSHRHYNTMPYTQFNRISAGSGATISGDLIGSTIIDDSYNSLNSIGQKQTHDLHHSSQQQKVMPWRHRQCPSRNSSSSGTSSTRWDMPSRHWLAVTSILLIAGAAGVAVPLALRVTAGAPLEERLQAATQLLDTVPLIDGHNDLPWNIRKFLHNQLNDFHFDDDLRNVMPWSKSPWSHTDLVRLRKGRVAAQFWAAYVPCEAQYKDAVQLTLEQIDVIKRLTDRYSPHLTTCTSAAEILEAYKNRQLCSLTGVEGGHSLGGSLGVLRTLYAIGVRYVTLTSTCHTPWADSSHADAPKFDIKHGGLTPFGKTIIREMNRLGMIVDLSHVSVGTMRDALSVTEAPVIFSHSSAYELCNSSRNVQDDILELIARNRGLVMVNFYSKFLSCSDNATVHDAVAHINHIKRVAGIDHVGLGAGFDGINYTPKGLEDVSSYPMLFAELLGDGWTVEELTKLAGQNILRVMEEVEKIRDSQRKAGIKPYEDIPNYRIDDPYNCTTS